MARIDKMVYFLFLDLDVVMVQSMIVGIKTMVELLYMRYNTSR